MSSAATSPSPWYRERSLDLVEGGLSSTAVAVSRRKRSEQRIGLTC